MYAVANCGQNILVLDLLLGCANFTLSTVSTIVGIALLLRVADVDSK